MTELRDGEVVLRALAADDFEAIWQSWRASTAFARPAQARARLLDRIERSPRLADGRLDLAIEAAGRLVGTIEARQPREGLPRGVFEIGIGLFAEDDRARGVGTRAARLFVEHLFAEHGAERVQASTALDNEPMRRVLEKLGFTREGVMRGFMPSPSGVGRDDYALYGVTRAEWLTRRGSGPRAA